MESSRHRSASVMIPNSTESQSRSSDACFEGHEPFESFQPKVAAVASKHFQLHVSKIKVHHMRGGSNNRVATVTFTRQPGMFDFAWFCSWFLSQSPETSTPATYVVRVPRFDGTAYRFTVDRDVAILKTVGALLKELPIPEVTAYDITSRNPIGKPYLIQPRLPGQNLCRLLNTKTLNMEQMKSIVRQVTRITETIARVEGPGGNISLKALSDPSQLHVESLHFEHEVLGDSSYTFPEPLPTTCEHLLKICQRWCEYQKANGHPFYDIWYHFGRIIKYLYVRDFLDGPCVLAHQDLEAYNLLVEVRSETEVEITGVIDWDSASIAPEFVAYKAPFWLWTVCSRDMPSAFYDREEAANLPPANEEAAILKQVFMENASEKYKFFAFSPEAMLARRMYVILREGTNTDWHLTEAWNIIRDWIKLYPDDYIPFKDPEQALKRQDKPVPDCESHDDSDSDSSVMTDNGSENVGHSLKFDKA
ncbi:hypothetical protein yc1106_04131 [Curvularia clavata]|uniref:Aminoglycoside phosphotransferase domain-containing protein n=1 Tax=Curvularia clavata TaxID=95742 RepID=A0A9Q8Z5S1_CURCL|nr:hypothetical protein yc1106_04131 [Curvularia clavata]